MDYQEYRRRVWGCYTGKAVGGTLGMPFEGDLSTRRLTGYEPEPTEMLPNDDLDLQIIDLEIVRRYGLPVNRYHLSTMWNHLQDAGPDEYGAARWNVALGRPAPLSGYFCNKFYAGMGAAIRSELWACLAPGDPELAVRLAREDACTDHYNDGLHACVFLTAVESAAFVESDLHKLVEIGLGFLPEDCRLARGLRDSFSYWAETRDPYAARELL
ncbi:MAG: ADP-ribosylglycohydrolase family protein, partial [Eubacteriales bacterium]|nr:ADP-ribosylglycohydrolase family protein [Eubacteriales bacterium]